MEREAGDMMWADEVEQRLDAAAAPDSDPPVMWAFGLVGLRNRVLNNSTL